MNFYKKCPKDGGINCKYMNTQDCGKEDCTRKRITGTKEYGRGSRVKTTTYIRK